MPRSVSLLIQILLPHGQQRLDHGHEAQTCKETLWHLKIDEHYPALNNQAPVMMLNNHSNLEKSQFRSKSKPFRVFLYQQNKYFIERAFNL
jgi:hypothetical protein